MNLKEEINQDFKDAFRAKNESQLSTLRLLLAAIKNKEVEKRTRLSKSEPIEKLEELSQLDDQEVIEVISSEIKKCKDAAGQYKQGGREELAAKEKKEIVVLSVYMPEQMGEGEIKKLVQEAIKKVGAAGLGDLGKVMGALMPQVKGKTDGNLVSKIVKEELGK
ncbi:MAG: hypothetical protein AUJ32_01055 [Parcubacteria group bacterium CG1_02_40_82]|uniref:Aspartyl-tRNA amidotransferase n=4 Tax=Candidatus Portnoyibacteriota TaxID=1817913 RepID=A0A2M7IHX9_9BACT|nr:MAG: hypothetical protein AUJ32_01055 [Parcubacteria group bacterium CG1_02_40_82]PIQ75383.1 MAG: aspartyl-tRNA amidotransferase [Candidatus Portnoybacteria bacterium CG11_big_fil_rev_8_21_14_0_20_40_15]PIS31509.1 MAG: aspartyl-tRNA amidotransferase [Candidatus Portnoybacteria bacterium CG08_land_8_20_14_0_20_40_83]PIW76102.1 MAG: aspartyl-tRNA amidotransferase [Candidatus Portnoybacteria bacterium CG_4_8_14_3_um_filter_40_10]PIY74861.1 MAG: aspartyl-tRNA amidotransferase [Candidatus Portnoy